MADNLKKKIFSDQDLVFTLSQTRQIQDLFMPPLPETQRKESDPGKVGIEYPRRLVNSEIVKRCVPGEETEMSRNNFSDMHLFYLKNIVYSALVPDIKIYKVMVDRDPSGIVSSKKVVELEFPRSLKNNLLGRTNANDFDLSRPVLDRGGQIGIKSFDWEYVGTDTFTANRDIRATLTMTMDGMGALAAVRKNKKGESYRLLDIVAPSASLREAEKRTVQKGTQMKYDAGAYELLVEAGYFVDEAQLNKLLSRAGVGSKSAISFTDSDINKAKAAISFDKMRSCMYLSVVDHQFDFRENGKTECTANFIARSNTEARQPSSNILISSGTSTALKTARETIKDIEAEIYLKTVEKDQAIAEKRRWIQYSVDIDQLNKSLEEYKQIEKELVDEVGGGLLSSILKTLEKPVSLGAKKYDSRIFEITLSNEQSNLFGEYMAEPTVGSLDDFMSSLPGRIATSTTAAAASATPRPTELKINPGIAGAAALDRVTYTPFPPQPDTGANPVTNVAFVFFGDLLDAVIEHSGKGRFEDYRFVLSNIRVPDIRTSSNEPTYSMPISAVPISISLLRATFEKKITSEKLQTMSILDFLRLCANTILPEALGRQSKKLYKNTQKKLKMTPFTHYKSNSKDDPTKTPSNIMDVVSLAPTAAANLSKLVDQEVTDANVANSLSEEAVSYDTSLYTVKPLLMRLNTNLDGLLRAKAKTKSMLDIFVVHEESNRDYNETLGDLQEDFKKRIPHYTHGQSYGLIKRVQLSKEDMPHLPEMRAEQTDDNSPDTYLTNMYKATFEMIGNDLNTLGGLIFFDPYGLDPAGSLGDPNDRDSLSFILGLGGAYIVTKIKHSMSPGSYKTTVATRFENRGQIKRSSKK
jgi:hypothetical protein